MNLDELASGPYGVLLLLTISVCGVLAFPVVDWIKLALARREWMQRHRDYLKVFKAQERRVR